MKKIILLFLCFCIGSSVLGQPVTNFPTREYSELANLNRPLPDVKMYGKRSLLVYGSNHTTNYFDPQIRQIRDSILSFRPTVILYEGDGIATEKTPKETVETYFEMGYAKYLADSLGIKAVNIEPPTQGKFQYLMSRYATDDILLATLGLQLTMMQVNEEPLERSFPGMVASLIKEGLSLTPEQQTLGYFLKLYERKMGKPLSYATFDSRDVQAKYNRTKYNRINQMANEYRDQHIIQLTQQFLKRKERVFLLEGGWHAIVCEPAYVLISK